MSGRGRTYEIRTYGCQMNVHDSERLAGLLEDAGYASAAGSDPDLVVFNTCAVRENADNRLYGNLGHLAPVKASRPGMQIAVGGCLAQKDGAEVTRRAPWVDVVFGTHNIGSLPVLLERARIEGESQVELREALETFPSALPARRDSAASAWVSISVGCNNSCTFCIVPSLRGVERNRPAADILAEVRALAAVGVLEITLLGQNVNSYGSDLGDRSAFARLLRSCGDVDGLERVRFTSPHPRDFTDDVIEAMASTPNVMPHLHMPMQSGSDAVLRAMRRSYRAAKYLGILARVRAAMPQAAITTDIIVGFPGETEADFQATLDVAREARFAGAYTFQYSSRPGTPAATMPGQVPREVVTERYARLVEVVEATALEAGRALIGGTVEVLVSDTHGRKDAAAGRLTGRARDGRLVHLSAADVRPLDAGPGAVGPAGSSAGDIRPGDIRPGDIRPGDIRPGDIRPGDIVEGIVTYAAPHHLVADGPLTKHRRTAAGDAWAQGRLPSIAPTTAPATLLGMPALRSSADAAGAAAVVAAGA